MEEESFVGAPAEELGEPAVVEQPNVEEEQLPPPPPSTEIEPDTPVPKQLRRRKVANNTAPIERPYIEMPEVNTNFWGHLLATQRAMEKTARSERLSNFVIT